MAKGATTLKVQLDQALTDLHNQGVVTELAKQYLDLDPDHILPTPTPTPQPEVTSTPGPPPSCVDGLAFLQHLNYDDQNMSAPPEMKPGQPFTKGWRVQNTGTCTWDSSYTLVYAGGNTPQSGMGGQPVAVQGQVPPGSTYDIEVDLVAPLKPGTYQAFWQMENGASRAFGERLPVGIRVPAAPTPTPAPTQTPVAGITFTVDRTNIKAGECVTFYWKVDNVKDVYFYHEGQNWQDHGVVGEGSQQECPPSTLTYYLRVVKLDGSVEVPQITIYVEASPDAPYIKRFTAEPPGQITLGQSVTIRWHIEGDVDTVTITANDEVLWGGAPVKGNTQDQPDSVGSVTYGIEAVGPGGTSRSNQTIQVAGEATATPAPTPEPDLPVINHFSVNPSQIQVGESVNISWSAGGGTSWVTILRDEYTVLDNAPFEGSIMDQPDKVGTVTYEVLAYNPQDQTANQKQPVQVSDVAPSNPLAGTQ
jgi:hypothetical protein